MADNKMSDIIKASLDGVKSFTDMDTVVGRVINTPAGVTVIPISKVSVGFAGGGLDYGGKKLTSAQNFGGGSGTGVSITPIAFLTVNRDSQVNLIPLANTASDIDRVAELIERSPEIIEKIKNVLL